MIWFLVAVAVAMVAGYFWAKSRKNRAVAQSSTPLRVTTGTSGSARDEMWLPIVGTSYHSAIDYAGDGRVEVRLKREPNNVHDPSAIGAWIGNRKLGYVPRRIAARYAPVIDSAGGTLRVPGYCSGGSIDVAPVGLPTAPSTENLRPITAWGWTSYACEVDGEFMNRAGIAAAFFAARVPITEAGAELDAVPALLLRASDGSDFIDVVINGQVVGFLPDNETATYHTVIEDLRARGEALQVPARIWARQGEKLRGRVTIQLPRADEIRPPSPLPTEPYVVLPANSSMQVTGEEAYQDALVPILGGRPSASVVATLHSAQIQKARSVADVVEVRVAGRTAGYLSGVSSANTIDLIRACEAAGRIPVAHGTLTGNSLKVELTVRTAKTADVSDEWLHAALR